jgi:hypothetical protein
MTIPFWKSDGEKWLEFFGGSAGAIFPMTRPTPDDSHCAMAVGRIVVSHQHHPISEAVSDGESLWLLKGMSR